MPGKSTGKKDTKKGKKKGDGTTIAPAIMPAASLLPVPRTSQSPPPPILSRSLERGQLSGSGILGSSMLSKLFTSEDRGDASETDTSLEDYRRNPNLTHSGLDFGLGHYPHGGRRSASMGVLDSSNHHNNSGFSDSEDFGAEGGIEERIIPMRARSDEQVYAEPRPKSILRTSGDYSSADDATFNVDGSVRTRSPSPRGRRTISPRVRTPDIEERVEREIIQTAHSSLQDPRLGSLRQSQDMNHTMSPKLQSLKFQNDQLLQKQMALQEQMENQQRLQEQIIEKLKEQGLMTTQRPDDTITEMGSIVEETRNEHYDSLSDIFMSGVTEQTKIKHEEVVITYNERISVLEEEKRELRKLNEKLQTENESVWRITPRGDGDDAGGTQSQMLKSRLREYKDECDTLKSAVQRINVELSRYQAKYRPPTDSSNKGLPERGPIPSWLINTKYLAPLFLAYDDDIAERDEMIHRYQIDFESLQQKMEDLIKENERLHIRIEQMNMSGPTGMSEWRQLQEQCKLVVEENQLLVERLDVQQKKSRDVHASHLHEVSKISNEVVNLKTEKAFAGREVEELKTKYTTLRQLHDSMVMENQSKLTVESHMTTMNEIKRSVQEEKSKFEEELERLKSELQATRVEKKSLNQQCEGYKASAQQAEAEVKALERAQRKSLKKILVLQKAFDEAVNGEKNASHYLNNVVKVAEKTVEERDSFIQKVHDEERQKKKALNKLLEGNIAVGRMEEKVRLLKLKANDKVEKALMRLKEQDEDFNSQRQEYERELRHLRQLLREREEVIELVAGEKKAVEEDLEVMWQSAITDNKKLRENMSTSLRKLKEHPGLSVAFKDEGNDLLLQCSDED